jgi:protein phosphatase
MKLAAAGKTHVGRRRSRNEDDYLLHDPAHLYAVADGMGGHAAGDVASRVALEVLQEFYGEPCTDDDIDLAQGQLAEAVRLANRRVVDAARQRNELRGMGTTLVAARFLGDQLLIANVGDSRAYLLRNGDLRQLTSDHSWVQEQIQLGVISPDEADNHPFRNMITRALGIRDNVEPDLSPMEARPGDKLLLCSDGLYVMLPDEEIAGCLAAPGEPMAICEELVGEANRRGGVDNITVVLVVCA